jgi:hypothetical protein
MVDFGSVLGPATQRLRGVIVPRRTDISRRANSEGALDARLLFFRM